jgi:hypothetical protein
MNDLLDNLNNKTMLIEKAVLNPNEDTSFAIVEWNEEKEDFVIDVPKGITRFELIELVEEIKFITKYE